MNNLISKHFTNANKIKINNMECSLWYDKEEDFPCNYIEEDNECNICFEHKKEFFKCNKCNYLSCPPCFNKYYFGEYSRCPQCRIYLFKKLIYYIIMTMRKALFTISTIGIFRYIYFLFHEIYIMFHINGSKNIYFSIYYNIIIFR